MAQNIKPVVEQMQREFSTNEVRRSDCKNK